MELHHLEVNEEESECECHQFRMHMVENYWCDDSSSWGKPEQAANRFVIAQSRICK